MIFWNEEASGLYGMKQEFPLNLKNDLNRGSFLS